MKKILILTVVLFVLITSIVILGNVITIGEKMTAATGIPYFEYAFYILLAGVFAYLVYLVVIQPMMRIHHAPEFPVLAVDDKGEGESEEVYRGRLVAFAGKLCDNCYYLPPSKRTAHQTEIRDELAKIRSNSDIEEVKAFLTKELKQRYRKVDKHILAYASKVFIITSISSSYRIDTFATLGLNYRMVADIVRASGFRPNKLQLVKLYYYVICSAFLSYFFQDVAESAVDLADSLADSADIDVTEVEIPDVDPSSVDFTEYIKSLNLPGIPLAPLADGLANAVMTLAIGYITKYYLQKGSKELKGAKGRSVKLKARMKALGQVPRLLVEVPQQLGNTGLSWAMKGFEKAYNKMTKDSDSKDFESDMDSDEYVTEDDLKPKTKSKKGGFFSFWRK